MRLWLTEPCVSQHDEHSVAVLSHMGEPARSSGSLIDFPGPLQFGSTRAVSKQDLSMQDYLIHLVCGATGAGKSRVSM